MATNMRYLTAIILLLISTVNVAKDNVVPNKLVQLIIDSKELNQYWHPEAKERVPLKIIHKYIGTSDGITKHGKNIVLIKKPDNSPYFEITSFSLSDGVWHISVAYPIEGVSGEFKAQMLPDRQWKLVSVSVVEH